MDEIPLPWQAHHLAQPHGTDHAVQIDSQALWQPRHAGRPLAVSAIMMAM